MGTMCSGSRGSGPFGIIEWLVQFQAIQILASIITLHKEVCQAILYFSSFSHGPFCNTRNRGMNPAVIFGIISAVQLSNVTSGRLVEKACLPGCVYCQRNWALCRTHPSFLLLPPIGYQLASIIPSSKDCFWDDMFFVPLVVIALRPSGS